jgi:chromosome segregation ATPase
MEPVVLVFLSTAVGTIVGVACAFLLMQRRTRGPAGEAAAAKGSQDLASVVAAPTVTIDDVRKLLAERDLTLEQCRDDLEKKQQQLEVATAAVESAAALRVEAEQRNHDLAAQVSAFTEQIKELAAKTKEGGPSPEESAKAAALESQLAIEKAQNLDSADQIAHLTDELARYKSAGAGAVTSLEAELDAEKVQIQQLTEQIASLSNELTGYRLTGAEAVTSIEAQLEAEKKQCQELADQVAVLTIDLSQARQYGTDADGYRSSLETELGVGRLRIAQLSDQVAEMTRELETRNESENLQVRELTERLAHLSSELSEYRVAAAEAMALVESQLDSEKSQRAEHVAALTNDLTQAKQYIADADSYRSSIEAELGVSRLRIMQLTDQIAELNRERSNFEVRLREERESAARGIELLSLAQSTLSGALSRLKEEQHLDGAPVPVAVAVVQAPPAEPEEPEEIIVEQPMEDLISEPAEAPVAVSA